MISNVTDAPVVKMLGVDELPAPYVDRSDEDSGVVIYGWAPSNVGESDNGWRIMKEVTENKVTKCLYPNGSMAFAFAWSERSNYTYGR